MDAPEPQTAEERQQEAVAQLHAEWTAYLFVAAMLVGAVCARLLLTP